MAYLKLSHHYVVALSTAVILGFEHETYKISEGDDSVEVCVEVCVEVRNGSVQNSLHFSVLVDGVASGEQCLLSIYVTLTSFRCMFV